MVPEWFYADQGQQKGPVTFEALQAMAANGKLRPSDLVWKNGMGDWVPASTQPGIFVTPTAIQDPIPAAAAAPEWVPPRDERTPYERSPYERPRPARGMSPGLKIGLTVGGVMMVGLLLCCGIGVVFVVAFGDKARTGEYSWSLGRGQYKSWTLRCDQGDNVVIKVFSTTNSDMDLFVFTDESKMNALLRSNMIENNLHLCLKADNGPSKDCEVRFTAPHTGTYYILIMNRVSMLEPQRNVANSGRMTYDRGPK